MTILATEEVSKKYANHLALDKASIAVEEKSIFGLLGPNGAGKTSLIRIINQITAPDSGAVYLNGDHLRPEHIAHIGYLPEERGLYKKMKVGEQALYLAQLKGLSRTDALKSLKEWFEKFEILGWWNRKVEELSKGMQQKVQFIVTVLHKPRLLIFDEPFSGFDPINTNLIKNEILRLRDEGASVIFSTHDMESVEELCDHIALFNKAKKLLDGKIADIREKYRSNTYEVVFRGNMVSFTNAMWAGYSLKDHKLKNGEIWATIEMTTKNGSPNELLGRILPQVDIISFNEVIPTVRDFFIQVVKEKVDS